MARSTRAIRYQVDVFTAFAIVPPELPLINYRMQPDRCSIQVQTCGAERVRVSLCKIQLRSAIPFQRSSRLKVLPQFGVFVSQTANDLFQFENRVKIGAEFVFQVVVIRPLCCLFCFLQQADGAAYKTDGGGCQS